MIATKKRRSHRSTTDTGGAESSAMDMELLYRMGVGIAVESLTRRTVSGEREDEHSRNVRNQETLQRWIGALRAGYAAGQAKIAERNARCDFLRHCTHRELLHIDPIGSYDRPPGDGAEDVTVPKTTRGCRGRRNRGDAPNRSCPGGGGAGVKDDSSDLDENERSLDDLRHTVAELRESIAADLASADELLRSHDDLRHTVAELREGIAADLASADEFRAELDFLKRQEQEAELADTDGYAADPAVPTTGRGRRGGGGGGR